MVKLKPWESALWMQVYAACVGGLFANPASTRARAGSMASEEADEAIKRMRSRLEDGPDHV